MQGRGETLNGRFGKIKIRGKNKYRGALINGTGRDLSLKNLNCPLQNMTCPLQNATCLNLIILELTWIVERIISPAMNFIVNSSFKIG
jgi:hypothetical protein